MTHFRFLIVTMIAAALCLPLGVRAVNDLQLIAGAQFLVDTTDTAVSVIGDMVGTVTEIDFQSNYLDIELDTGSSATFTVPAGRYLTVTKQSGAGTLTTAPSCIEEQVTMSGTGNLIARLEVSEEEPACAKSTGSQGGLLYPTQPIITIADGQCTDSSSVTVEVGANTASEFLLSNSPSLVGSEWQPLDDPEAYVIWELEPGDGLRTVYAQFRNGGAYLSPIVSAQIVVDSSGACGTIGPIVDTKAPEDEAPPRVVPIPIVPDRLYLRSDIRPGDLVKGSLDTVYYVGQNGRRHAFPNPQTFFVWFDSFSQVKVMRDSELAQIPLGANVTYRPGVRLIKVQSDPKVYAVQGMTLRWVETEEVARELFGLNWARRVDDLPEVFFEDYKIGPSIRSASDYSAVESRFRAPSIDSVL